MKHALFYLLLGANIINLVHLGLFVIGGNMYDIFKWRNNYKLGKTVTKRFYGRLVSIVIPAHNEELNIATTVESALNTKYRNKEIIVVNDGSTDKTVRVLRSYILNHRYYRDGSLQVKYRQINKQKHQVIMAVVKRHNITIVSQANKGKGAALNKGITYFAKGKFVMCLDGDSKIDKMAVTNAVMYFKDPGVVGVAANVKVVGKKSFINNLQKFDHLIGYRAKKFYSLTNTEFIIGGVASTYLRDEIISVGLYDTDTLTEDIGLSLKLIATLGNKNKRIVYAADVVAMTEGVDSFKGLFKQRLRWKTGALQNLMKYHNLFVNSDYKKYSAGLTHYRLPMAILAEFLLLLEPLTLGYAIYLSIHFHTIAILVGAYVTITLYMMWIIWPDEHMSNRQKVLMSLQALEMYLLLYAMDIIQVNAIYRCVFQAKKLLKRSEGQTWISPKRVGIANEI